MGQLGAHISIAGGIEKALKRGESIGCESIQIFTKNQRRWKAGPLSKDTIERFDRVFQTTNIRQVVVHDSYLINLAHPDDEKGDRSQQAFQDELRRAGLLKARALVFHPGSHMDTGVKAGVRRIAKRLRSSLESDEGGNCQLLLETTSGQGTQIGSSLEQLSRIIEKVRSERLGICFDTAHAFASGMDLSDEESYDTAMRRLESVLGMEHVKCFHLNDSRAACGEKKDRHEIIGRGFIGEAAFRMLVQDRRFENVPMILETPGGYQQFKEQLIRLKTWRENKESEWN